MCGVTLSNDAMKLYLKRLDRWLHSGSMFLQEYPELCNLAMTCLTPFAVVKFNLIKLSVIRLATFR